MEKIPAYDFRVHIVLRWVCPKCNREHKLDYEGSPYRNPSEDLPDVHCVKCDEFFELYF